MGIYLNSKKAYHNYQKIRNTAFFVDKTLLLEELIPIVDWHLNEQGGKAAKRESSNEYICITRPRRFGKTVMANMISSYFGKGTDSRGLFAGLKITSCERFEAHLNRHNVIAISMNELPQGCRSYQQYIDRIQKRLLKDLMSAYPDVKLEANEAVWDACNHIFESEEDVRFLFVLDEWDFIFHQDFVTEAEKRAYTEFLSMLLKDQPYVELAYMTGILPIAKYSSGSELNMFYEYTMATEEKFGEYFGFTERETDELYAKYQKITEVPKVSREDLRFWYDGYSIRTGEQIYNPRSVVAALTNNNLANYWTSAGPYDEIFYYIKHNVDAVRDDVALMAAGGRVPARVREYASTSMCLKTKDEIFSAMVVYGFLNYEDGYVSIPNKELMDQFSDMLRKEPSLGYVYRLAKESERMLQATLDGNTESMLEILSIVHNTEIPILRYNNEADLSAVVNLVYLSARDFYRIEREDRAGIGYVDFIFYPEQDLSADCIILELKVDHTPEEAIQQIKDKQYALRFAPRLGETPKYTGRILAVGIAYDRKTKKHSCKIEELK